MQLQRQLLAAKLAHELVLVLHQDDLALVDHTDAIGHFLRLVDVVRGEDDGHAGFAQLPHHPPHDLAELHVDPGGRFVEKQYLRLVHQRLGDQNAAFHAPGQCDDFRVLPVPKGQVLQHLFNASGIGGLAKQAAAERNGFPHRHERIDGELLRHEPDHRTGGAVVGNDIVPIHAHAPGGRRHDSADDADQRCLSGAVRAEQPENLAPPNFEVNVLQRLEAGGVGLGEALDGNDRLHERRHRGWRLRPDAAVDRQRAI